MRNDVKNKLRLFNEISKTKLAVGAGIAGLGYKAGKESERERRMEELRKRREEREEELRER